MTEQGYTISSPREPNGTGELKNVSTIECAKCEDLSKATKYDWKQVTVLNHTLQFTLV